jgi:hypothetical protein
MVYFYSVAMTIVLNVCSVSHILFIIFNMIYIHYMECVYDVLFVKCMISYNPRILVYMYIH